MTNLKPSTALRNDYQQIAALAKATGEPIYITNKGEADLVVLSMDGAPTFSIEEVRARLEEKYAND